MAIQDMTGKTFGRLKVVSLERPHGGKSFWLCLCECGETRPCIGAVLRQGRVTACRTCSVERMRERLTKRSPKRPRLNDPDAMAAALDETGRRLYDRWQNSCARLSVHITRSERIDVLRELVDKRKAA